MRSPDSALPIIANSNYRMLKGLKNFVKNTILNSCSCCGHENLYSHTQSMQFIQIEQWLFDYGNYDSFYYYAKLF